MTATTACRGPGLRSAGAHGSAVTNGTGVGIKAMSRRLAAAFLATLCAMTLLHAVASAEEYGFVEPFGFADARLMAMGYSHVAVWDEPNPLYSNPAAFGLRTERLALTFGSAWGEGAGPTDFKFIALSDMDRGGGAGGFAWGHYEWHDGDALFSGNTFNYSVGKSFAKWGALGFGVRYLRGAAADAAADDPNGDLRWRGLATDAGLVVKHNAISLGVVARDVTSTRLVFDDGTAVTLRPSYSAGLSLRLSAGTVVAVDAHRASRPEGGLETYTYTGGFEGWLTPHIALRGGIVVGDGGGLDVKAYTGGIGLRFGDFEMSYAVLTGEEQGKRQCISLTRRF